MPRVQGTRGTSASTPCAATLTLTPVDGNSLILISYVWKVGGSVASAISSIVQTGATWTKQAGPKLDPGTYSEVEIWAAFGVSGAGKTITVNYAAAVSGAIVDVYEYSGIAPSPLDKTANANGTASPTNTGTTATTSQGDELLVGATGAVQTSTITQSAPTNGFTLLDGAVYASGYYGCLAYLEKIVAATGTYISGTTIDTNPAANWAGLIATFRLLVSVNVNDAGSSSDIFGKAFDVSDSGAGADTPARLYSIGGRVLDVVGNPIVATLWLFRTSDEAFIMSTVSEVDGTYIFAGVDSDGGIQYFIRGHSDSYLGNRVFGTTDRTLVAS